VWVVSFQYVAWVGVFFARGCVTFNGECVWTLLCVCYDEKTMMIK
jgi:hypothetical protein